MNSEATAVFRNSGRFTSANIRGLPVAISTLWAARFPSCCWHWERFTIPGCSCAAPIVGYGFAWIGHFAIEKNRPATFQYPLWSLIADWKMWAMMLVGRMSTEVERAKRTAGSSS